jgi:hypothetical protein
MLRKEKVASSTAVFLVLGLWALPAAASWLNVGTPYYDGTTLWEGTTYIPLTPTTPLSGYAEWAVYAPGKFPFSGYVPTSGEFAYVYQFFGTGSAAVSSFSVPIDNPGDNIGTFVDSGDGLTGNCQPISPMNLYGPPDGSASWGFAGGSDPGILTGQSSWALVFSSPYAPVGENATIVDDGTFQQGGPVASPGTHLGPVPEPAALWLLGSGMSLMLARWWWRRRSLIGCGVPRE